MRRNAALWLAVGAACCLQVAGRAADVTVKLEGTNRHVTAPAYEAVVADDGSLTSLRVGGQEFVDGVGTRGMYFYQAGVPKLTKVEQPADGVIVASGEKASARFDFGTDAVTCTLANLTGQSMEYVIVFDSAVAAVASEGGHFLKTSVNRNWDASTWFRANAKLRIESTKTKLWGPFAENHQVWTTAIGPNETRKMTLMAGTASKDEMANAAEAVKRGSVAPKDPVGPMWDLKVLGKAPRVYPAPGFEAEGCKAIFYGGRPYQGERTRVFAWLGLPKMEPGQKVPGIVLVHGGGGTAFDAWVRLWTSRGYAAIAIDTCGAVPKGSYANWNRHDLGGPPGWGGFDQIDEPREDQWTYHAVADAILANSLLRSLPEVDPDRIGLTGISWGGYLTCIIAGADDRFRFAVPVYGCGFTLDMSFAGSVTGLGKERADRWMRWWDPSAYLHHAAMPMLWVTGSNDFAYIFPALQKSYRLPTGPRTLAIRLRMPHGHGGPGENPEEIHAFADSILKGGVPLPKITGQGREGKSVWATVTGSSPVVKAELNVTKDRGNWPDRKWDALPAKVEGGKVTATLPEGVTVWYLNLYDGKDRVVSTEHEEMK